MAHSGGTSEPHARLEGTRSARTVTDIIDIRNRPRVRAGTPYSAAGWGWAVTPQPPGRMLARALPSSTRGAAVHTSLHEGISATYLVFGSGGTCSPLMLALTVSSFGRFATCERATSSVR